MCRTFAAITLGKFTAWLIGVLKAGSGTSLPGKLALRVDPDLLKKLGRQIRQKMVVITGTNGKSTTAGMLSAFIEAGNLKVIHNQLGANMIGGITTALLRDSSISGRINADFGVIEVDEASMPAVSDTIKQDLTVVTNLFRDQLDRYGELDTTAKLIQFGIQKSEGYIALNADDPMVAGIALQFPKERVIYYGVDKVEYPSAVEFDFPVGFPSEVTDCPVCQAPLNYTKFLYGHLGHYSCTNCDFKRPEPWLTAESVYVTSSGSLIQLQYGDVSQSITLDLPGLFNAYNLLAAATAGAWFGNSVELWHNALSSYKSIFGRAEKREIAGKSVMILLIKNPIGATEVLKVVTADPKKRIIIMINDNYADGRDISWLWDAPFELLLNEEKPLLVSGHRAEDMAVRMLYAGFPQSLINTEPDIIQALQTGLSELSEGETLYVLPTYTALLQLSQFLKSR